MMIFIIYFITLLIDYCKSHGDSIPCEFLVGGCTPDFDPPFLQPSIIPSYSYPIHQNLHQERPVFVPSPPGKQPSCANHPRKTFCERVDKYPENLIYTLAKHTRYDFRTLFTDENGDGYATKRPSIHGRKDDKNYNFGRVKAQVSGQYPAIHSGSDVSAYRTFNNTQKVTNKRVGYPDRTYHLPESQTHIVDPILYSTYVEPSIQTSPSDWWNRSDKAGFKNAGGRRRRQSTDVELCSVRSEFITPRAGLNSRGEWKFIVNVEQGADKYRQLVKSETCLSDECNGICSLPSGYTSRCEQRYVQKRLVALEGTGTQLYTDIFWFPHCCVCQIIPVDTS